MNIYIQKDTTTIYVELDFLLDENSYEIGTTWEDYKNGKWVLLSEEQVAFREENPDASAEEVFNMELNPEPTELTQEDILSSEAIATANVPEMQLMSFAKMAVNTMSLTDEQALSVKLLHPEWKEFIGGSLSVGERVMYDDKLYKVKQEINPVLENQPPSIETAALYEEINEKHAGTKEDPIPFNNNMELELGKYYSQNGVTYMCFRDSQQPVYQNLADLVGIYVQIAE